MPTPRSGPSITGTPQEGQTLTGNNGQWLYANGLGCGSECQYSWQWQRCNAGGGGCANIAGATNRTYLLTSDDVGNRVLAVNILSKFDCDALNQNCKTVTSSQNSALTVVITPKAVLGPTATTNPAITGLAMEEETLTASAAAFSGPQPITVTYQWQRCDANGANCANIAGATAQTYALTTADVGARVRIVATGTNAGGSATAASAPTDVVQALAPRPGKTTLTIDKLALPHRLIIDKVTIKPATIRSSKPFTVRVRVSEDRGFQVVGALVRVTGVPYGQIKRVREAATDATGWATFTITPTAKLQLERGKALYLYIQVRKPGETVETGVSNTKLVPVKVSASA
jgi:hypothetical protein